MLKIAKFGFILILLFYLLLTLSFIFFNLLTEQSPIAVDDCWRSTWSRPRNHQVNDGRELVRECLNPTKDAIAGIYRKEHSMFNVYMGFSLLLTWIVSKLCNLNQLDIVKSVLIK